MSRKARFEIRLSQPVPSESSVSVNYHTEPGTATAPSDYTHVEGTLEFAPGEEVKYVEVPIRDASIAASIEEMFQLVLADPEGTGNATATIVQPGAGDAVLPAVTNQNEYLNRFHWMFDAVTNPVNEYMPYDRTGGEGNYVNNYLAPYYASQKDGLILVDDRMPTSSADTTLQVTSETFAYMHSMLSWWSILNSEMIPTVDWIGLSPHDNPYGFTYAMRYPSVENPISYDDGFSFIIQMKNYGPETNSLAAYPDTTQLATGVGDNPLDQFTRGKLLSVCTTDMENSTFTPEDNAFVPTLRSNLNANTRGRYESVYQTTIPWLENFTYPDDENDNQAYPNVLPYRLFFTDLTSGLVNSYKEDYFRQKTYRNHAFADFSLLHWVAVGARRAQNIDQEEFMDSRIQSQWTKYDLAYNTFDKHFRKVGADKTPWEASGDGTPHLGLINMSYELTLYTSISSYTSYSELYCSSDCHHAYQNLVAIYGLNINMFDTSYESEDSNDIQFMNSALSYFQIMNRQIFFLRWLQSPEGPFAGGVTNSFNGRYEVPTGGRQTHTFCGMHYDYAPGKVNPPSNNLVEWQTKGHCSTADMLLLSATDFEGPEVYNQLEVILDRLVKWFLTNSSVSPEGVINVPISLRWTSNSVVGGQTATTPNSEGTYEYLPSITMTEAQVSDSDYIPTTHPYWSASSVPNPNLHCTITSSGEDLGVASSMAYLLIAYAAAKDAKNKLDTVIPGSSRTPRDAMELAKQLLDAIWENYRDPVGVSAEETRADYVKMGDLIPLPDIYTPGEDEFLPTLSKYKEDITTDVSTFLSLRPFLKNDPRYKEVSDFINGQGSAPVFKYHRTWVQCIFASANAALHRYFADEIY